MMAIYKIVKIALEMAVIKTLEVIFKIHLIFSIATTTGGKKSLRTDFGLNMTISESKY